MSTLPYLVIVLCGGIASWILVSAFLLPRLRRAFEGKLKELQPLTMSIQELVMSYDIETGQVAPESRLSRLRKLPWLPPAERRHIARLEAAFDDLESPCRKAWIEAHERLLETTETYKEKFWETWPCEKCGGKGKVYLGELPVYNPCPSCSGRGYHLIMNMTIRQARELGIDPYIPCQRCGGKGEIFLRREPTWGRCNACGGRGKKEGLRDRYHKELGKAKSEIKQQLEKTLNEISLSSPELGPASPQRLGQAEDNDIWYLWGKLGVQGIGWGLANRILAFLVAVVVFPGLVQGMLFTGEFKEPQGSLPPFFIVGIIGGVIGVGIADGNALGCLGFFILPITLLVWVSVIQELEFLFGVTSGVEAFALWAVLGLFIYPPLALLLRSTKGKGYVVKRPRHPLP